MNENRFLILDDDPALCRLFGEIAAGLGYTAEHATSGGKFKEAVARFEPSVISLDLHVPGFDGIEALRYLAGLHCHSAILLASGTDLQIIRSAEKLGREHNLNVVASLQKPVAVTALESVLRDQLAAGELITDEAVREALAEGQFALQFHPKARAAENGAWGITSVEAQLIWAHPVYGHMVDRQFLSRLEDSGLLLKITDYVLTTALSHAKQWREQKIRLMVGIDYPPELLTDLRFPDQAHGIQS